MSVHDRDPHNMRGRNFQSSPLAVPFSSKFSQPLLHKGGVDTREREEFFLRYIYQII